MAITSGFFNSVSGDRKYNAEEIGNYFEGLISNGIFENIGDRLVVTAGTGLSVNIGTGRAFVQCHWLKNDTTLTLELEPADVQYSRTDAIVIRYDNRQSVRSVDILVKTGTPSINADAPTLERTNDVYELVIAYVFVSANATSITQDKIRDMRTNTDVCGWVTGVIKQVDTADLFLQWQTAFDSYYSEMTSQFNSWFSSLTETLQVNLDVVKYQNVINLTADTIGVPLGISEYEVGDVVLVHINGVMLVEGDEYEISLNTSGSYALTFQKIIKADNTITIIVIKSGLSS